MKCRFSVLNVFIQCISTCMSVEYNNRFFIMYIAQQLVLLSNIKRRYIIGLRVTIPKKYILTLPLSDAWAKLKNI